MNIGKSIRRALLDRGWSQKLMASKLGVSANTASTLSRSSSCGGEKLRQLADIFGMRVSEFVALGEDGATTLVAPVIAPYPQPQPEEAWIAVDADSFPSLIHGDWVQAKNVEESGYFESRYQMSKEEYWWLGRDGEEVTVTHYR